MVLKSLSIALPFSCVIINHSRVPLFTNIYPLNYGSITASLTVDVTCMTFETTCNLTDEFMPL